MIAWALAKLAPLWGKIVLIAGAVAAVLGALAMVRKGGRDAERADVARRTLEDVARANEVREDVDRVPDADVTGQLFKRWGRKPNP